jgi:hypothetical protein
MIIFPASHRVHGGVVRDGLTCFITFLHAGSNLLVGTYFPNCLLGLACVAAAMHWRPALCRSVEATELHPVFQTFLIQWIPEVVQLAV